MISRLLQIIGLFCKRALKKRGYSLHLELMDCFECLLRKGEVWNSGRLYNHPFQVNRISSLLQGSFAKEPYKREDILQKSPMIFRSLLIVFQVNRISSLL